MTDIAAIAARNAALNAFIDFDDEARGGDGPLAGVTVGVKSNIAVRGLPWTAGMALHRGRIAVRDAAVVARLRAAGAIILGTLNMDEAALGAKTDNPWYGDTRNPHAPGYSAGGSSGGSGAAVAAGLCDLALGTDTMGSVRIPASYCGVYGFKPANRAIEPDGVEPCEPTFDAVGLIAGSPGLIERALAVCTGTAPTPDLPLIGSGVVTLRDLGGVVCEPTVRAAHDRACRTLDAADGLALPHPLSRVRFAGFIKTARALSAALADADPALLSARLKRLIAYGPARSAADWADDERVLADTAAAVHAALDRYRYLLLPTTPGVAFPHTQDAPASQADFTCIANIADLPALSVPAGFNLKPGVDPAAYEAWARGTDMPGVNALGSVRAFTVHRATGLFGSDAPSPYAYIEVIDIRGMDAFVADVTDPEFQAVAAAFGDFADNPQFILTEDL